MEWFPGMIESAVLHRAFAWPSQRCKHLSTIYFHDQGVVSINTHQ